LASAAFLASSSLYASPAVSPTCNAWPKMAVKDANPSGVLVSIADNSEALKWSAIIFLNLSSLLSPPPDPEPPPLVPAIAIRNLFSTANFPSTILEQIWEWIQIHSPILKDFQQFRACNVNLRYTISRKGVWVSKMTNGRISEGRAMLFRKVRGLRSWGLC
jgi:hypothetical protein